MKRSAFRLLKVKTLTLIFDGHAGEQMVLVERNEADCLCVISDVLEHQATGDVYHPTQYLSDGLKCRVV
jgi:hypothetical protein